MIAPLNRTGDDFLRNLSRTVLAALLASTAGACLPNDEYHNEPDDPTMGEDSGKTHDTADPPGGPCDTGHPDTDGTQPPGSTGESEDTESAETGAVETGDVDTGGEAESGEAESGEEPPTALCGNGVVDAGEACDDGVNDGAYNGCRPGCGGPGPFCGDGTINDPSEACDDGNQMDDDGCTQSCAVPVCGDEVVQGEEACDGGALGGASCESLGFPGGTLACNLKCSELDTTGCLPLPPATASCCTPGAPDVCQDAAVTACVCELAPECCEKEWSELCVDMGIKACAAMCP